MFFFVLLHMSQMRIRRKDEILNFYFILVCMLDILLNWYDRE